MIVLRGDLPSLHAGAPCCLILSGPRWLVDEPTKSPRSKTHLLESSPLQLDKACQTAMRIGGKRHPHTDCTLIPIDVGDTSHGQRDEGVLNTIL